MPREHFDVLIVGAGLSGIGAGYHLQTKCPGRSYAILEARDCIGGTWDLFRYPGVRSDSDMYTLGYPFRPWRDSRSIADGPSILNYVRETAREHGIERRIRFHHRVVAARFSTPEARWTLDVERTDTGETEQLTCGFLFMCSGYYRYDGGYTPTFAGSERFCGPIVHPQHWTDDIEYAGKRVVVIGSGATAVTLVPALAASAAHVTMLQRSPSYVISLPAQDAVAGLVRRLLSPRLTYSVVRWKNVVLTMLHFQFSRRRPEAMRRLIRRWIEAQLPTGYDVDTHFNPRYNPWDQRLCLVPDGDLFTAISEGRASMVTDRIDRFTPNGIRLVSGQELPADLIVTATGLNLLPLGGLEISVDDHRVDVSQRLGYKGMMLSGVPNLASAFGYTNASWTLKSDLTCGYVCRLLNHMAAHGYRQCTPRDPGPGVERRPFIDFSSGYVQRSIDRFPKQGPRAPWRLYQNYALDLLALRYGRLEDGTLQFANGRVTVGVPELS